MLFLSMKISILFLFCFLSFLSTTLTSPFLTFGGFGGGRYGNGGYGNGGYGNGGYGNGGYGNGGYRPGKHLTFRIDKNFINLT